jgi:hypothetical protein
MNRTIAQSIFFIVMFGELMRHFSSDPHFSIVPRSLAYAAKDIMFLMVVIATMTLCFATVLGALYGSTLPEFSTLKSAMLTVIMMTLGDWGDAYYGILSITDYTATWTFLFVLYNVGTCWMLDISRCSVCFTLFLILLLPPNPLNFQLSTISCDHCHDEHLSEYRAGRLFCGKRFPGGGGGEQC